MSFVTLFSTFPPSASIFFWIYRGNKSILYLKPLNFRDYSCEKSYVLIKSTYLVVLSCCGCWHPHSYRGAFLPPCFLSNSCPVLRIRDILVRIRIRGSGPLTKGSGFGSCYFRQRSSRFQLKNFFSYYFLKLHSHHFSNKIKSHKEVSKQKESRVFLLFSLDDRRIRIRTSY